MKLTPVCTVLSYLLVFLLLCLFIGCSPYGAWDLLGQLAAGGPGITSVTANDPDDLDSAYGNGDTLTVMFGEYTNQVAVATKAEIDAVFSFSQSLGTDYNGAWSAPDTLVITIVDSTASTPPTIGGLILTFQAGNGVNNTADISSESSGSSPAAGGDWGTPIAAGPTITSVTADDPDDLDSAYGNGDTLTVLFSENTNQVAAATKAEIDAVFSFNQSLGSNYTGAWSAPDTLVITVVDSTASTPPTIGGLVLTFQAGNGVKNAAATSVDSTGSSAVIGGNWGTPIAGPTISSVTADDPDDLDSAYGNGDTLTVLFSENTNQIAAATKAEIDAIFSFNQSLGTDYTGAWSAPDTLVITVVDSTASTPPTIGGLVLTFQAGNGVKNAAATSADSTGSSPAIGGNWGYFQVTLTAAHDTILSDMVQTSNFGSATSLIINQEAGDIGRRRILVDFDLSTIPAGATVTSAILKLTKTGGTTGTLDIGVYRVQNTWVEAETTWQKRDNGNLWSPWGGEYDATDLDTTTVSVDVEYQWSSAALTSLVEEWHQGTTSNFGLILGSEELGSNDRYFASREHGSPAMRPQLVVEYTVP